MEQLVTIEQAKQHLIIDVDFTVDDELIKGYIEAAQAQVSEDSCRNEAELVGDDGNVLPLVRQAVLILVGEWYDKREDPSVAAGYNRIINLLRKYDK